MLRTEGEGPAEESRCEVKSKEPPPIHGAVLWLAERVRELEQLTRALAERVQKQSDLLAKRAEKTS